MEHQRYISESIAVLLYDHPVVTIPGFGAFETSYQSAAIDYVQGYLRPPAYSVRFNANLTTDDGRLTQYIADTHSIPTTAAQQAVSEYADALKTALRQREIVVLPHLGRLFNNYERETQFVADSTNFNRGSFGLPTVQFYPILRDRPTKAAPVAATPVAAATEKAVPVTPKMDRRLLIPIFAAVGLLLVVSVWVFMQEGPEPTAPATQPVSGYLNQKPGAVEETPVIIDEPTAPATTLEPTPPSVADIDTEGATLPPQTQSCIVVIGVFGQQANASEITERIQLAGYDVYSKRKANGHYVIGAQFDCERGDVDRNLRDIRKKFAKDAFLLKQ